MGNKVIVKIDKRTLRENPNAGKTSFSIPGPKQVFMTYTGNEVPKKIKEMFIVYSSMKSINGPVTHELQSFKPIQKRTLLSLGKNKNISDLRIEMDMLNINSRTPDPKYLYRYTNPSIECSECHEYTKFKEIEPADLMDGDGYEYSADQCPKCGAINSFDYELESPPNK